MAVSAASSVRARRTASARRKTSNVRMGTHTAQYVPGTSCGTQNGMNGKSCDVAQIRWIAWTCMVSEAVKHPTNAAAITLSSFLLRSYIAYSRSIRVTIYPSQH
jgi:hypothetical protein